MTLFISGVTFNDLSCCTHGSPGKGLKGVLDSHFPQHWLTITALLSKLLGPQGQKQ